MRKALLLAFALVWAPGLAGCSGADPGADEPADASPLTDEAAWTWSDDEHGLALVTGSDVAFGLAEFAVAPRNGSAFLVGGFTDAGGGSPTVLLVDFTESRNGGMVVPSYPLPVHHTQAAVVDGWLYVFGGYDTGAVLPGSFVPGAGPAGWPQTPLAFRLDLSAGGAAWEPIASLPEARSAGGAVVVDDKVLLVGGVGLGGYLASTLEYDPATDSYRDLAPLPTPRDHLNVLEHAGLVYAVAGRVNEGGAWDDLETFEVYDPAADAWTPLPPVPLGRGGQAAAFLGDRLVVVGGEKAEGSFDVFDDAHAYDLATGDWTEVPRMPEPRHGGGLVAFEDSLYYLGGARLDGSLASTTLRLTLA